MLYLANKQEELTVTIEQSQLASVEKTAENCALELLTYLVNAAVTAEHRSLAGPIERPEEGDEAVKPNITITNAKEMFVPIRRMFRDLAVLCFRNGHEIDELNMAGYFHDLMEYLGRAMTEPLLSYDEFQGLGLVNYLTEADNFASNTTLDYFWLSRFEPARKKASATNASVNLVHDYTKLFFAYFADSLNALVEELPSTQPDPNNDQKVRSMNLNEYEAMLELKFEDIFTQSLGEASADFASIMIDPVNRTLQGLMRYFESCSHEFFENNPKAVLRLLRLESDEKGAKVKIDSAGMPEFLDALVEDLRRNHDIDFFSLEELERLKLPESAREAVMGAQDLIQDLADTDGAPATGMMEVHARYALLGELMEEFARTVMDSVASMGQSLCDSLEEVSEEAFYGQMLDSCDSIFLYSITKASNDTWKRLVPEDKYFLRITDANDEGGADEEEPSA